MATFLPLQSYSCGSSLPAVSNRQRKLLLQTLNGGILPSKLGHLLMRRRQLWRPHDQEEL